MRFIQRFAGVLFSIYGFTVFLLLMFLIFPFVLLAGILPEKKRANIIYILATFWADAAMAAWGIRHENIYETPHDPNHSAIFVFNHISYMDIPMILKALRGQHIRVLGKAEMSKIPIFGLIYRSAAITVDRSSPEGRANSVKQLKKALEHNISVVIAPEGTFNMTHEPLKNFYDGAFRIAIEMQRPIKPVLFLDTYDRLQYTSIFTLTPGRCRSVFLSETQTTGMNPEDIPLLKEKIYNQMNDALVRYKASWIKS